MKHTALFIGGEIYRHSSYGAGHPLSIPRVSTATDLARAMGWLTDTSFLDSPVATGEALERFHHRDYIDAVRTAEHHQRIDPDLAARYHLGRLDNPIFPEMYRRPATAAGAAEKAAALLAEARDRGRDLRVYSPASGTHHALAARASGFCYFNAPVLGILGLLDRGFQRVLYIDLDAHHGDGVEFAFAGDPRVLTVSIHEQNRWPHTGRVEDRAGGSARNLPVPAGFNDTELAWIVTRALLPLADRFAPDALVLQTGADGLDDDPLSGLALSNLGLWTAVQTLLPLARHCLMVGGGGYNPWSVGRCWAGLWAVMAGLDPAQPPTPEAESVLRALTWDRRRSSPRPDRWFTTLADPANPGPVRPAVVDVAAAALT